MGKVIGGGLPVGAYGGRRDIMQLVAPAGGRPAQQPCRLFPLHLCCRLACECTAGVLKLHGASLQSCTAGLPVAVGA